MYIIALIWITQLAYSFLDKSASKDIGSVRHAVKYSAVRGVMGAACIIVIALLSGQGLKFDLTSVLCAVTYGTAVVVDLINALFLVKTGMLALMSVSNQAASLIMPTVAGIVFFSKPVNPIQWLFVLVLLIAIYILCVSSKGIYKDFSIKTVLMLILRFIIGGIGTISLQTFAKVGNGNTNSFLAVAYLVAAALSFAVYPFFKTEKGKEKIKLSKKLMAFALIVSICMLADNALVVMAARVLDPIIQFSLTAVGGIVLNLLLGAICFKEKITVKSVVAIIIAAISVVMINYFN